VVLGGGAVSYERGTPVWDPTVVAASTTRGRERETERESVCERERERERDLRVVAASPVRGESEIERELERAGVCV